MSQSTPNNKPDVNDFPGIYIGGRVLRDAYCSICQPALRGTIATTTWHAPSSKCERDDDIHCNCKPCRSIAP
jgi:hypothetical protein